MMELRSFGVLIAATLIFSVLSAHADQPASVQSSSALDLLIVAKSKVDQALLTELAEKEAKQSQDLKSQKDFMQKAIDVFLDSDSTESAKIAAVKALEKVSVGILRENQDALALMRGIYPKVSEIIQSLLLRIRQIDKGLIKDPNEAPPIVPSADKIKLQTALALVIEKRRPLCWHSTYRDDASAFEKDLTNLSAEKKRADEVVFNNFEKALSDVDRNIVRVADQLWETFRLLCQYGQCDHIMIKMLTEMSISSSDLSRYDDTGLSSDRTADRIKEIKALPRRIKRVTELMTPTFQALYEEPIVKEEDPKYWLTPLGRDYFKLLLDGNDTIPGTIYEVKIKNLPALDKSLAALQQSIKKSGVQITAAIETGMKSYVRLVEARSQAQSIQDKIDELQEKKESVTKCISDREVVDALVKNATTDIDADVAQGWTQRYESIRTRYEHDLKPANRIQ